MTGRDRWYVAVLVLDAVLLAIVELLFLPLWVGSIPLPVTALVALTTTPMLVSRAAEVCSGRLGGGAPLWAWLATVGVFGLTGPGGDMVLIPDWRALLLLACGTLPAAVVLGNALARRRRSGRQASR